MPHMPPWALVLLLCVSAECAELSLQLAPTKEQFLATEPMAAELILVNHTSRDMRLEFRYPHLAMEFTCADESAVHRVQRDDTTGSTWLIGPVLTTRLRAGGNYRVVLALARYFRFKRAKAYRVAYHAMYRDIAGSGKGKPVEYRLSGQFIVRVVEGKIPQRGILMLRRGLVSALESLDPARVRQAVELLCWTDDPRVIGSLELAAQRFDPAGPDVARALSRFGRSERGRSALLKAARTVDERTLPLMLAACSTHGIKIPHDLYEELFSSKSRGIRWRALTHLSEHRAPEYLTLVKILERDGDEQIAALARGLAQSLIEDAASGKGQEETVALPDQVRGRIVQIGCRKHVSEADMMNSIREYEALLSQPVTPDLIADVHAEIAQLYFHAAIYNRDYADKAAEHFEESLQHDAIDVLPACERYLLWSRALTYDYLHRKPQEYAAARTRALVPCLKGLELVLTNQIVGPLAGLPPIGGGRAAPEAAEERRAYERRCAAEARRRTKGFQDTLLSYRPQFIGRAAWLFALKPHADAELRQTASDILSDDAAVEELMSTLQREKRNAAERQQDLLKKGFDPRVMFQPPTVLPPASKSVDPPAADGHTSSHATPGREAPAEGTEGDESETVHSTVQTEDGRTPLWQLIPICAAVALLAVLAGYWLGVRRDGHQQPK